MAARRDRRTRCRGSATGILPTPDCRSQVGQQIVDALIGDPEFVAECLNVSFERPYVHLIGAIGVSDHVWRERSPFCRRSRLHIDVIGHQHPSSVAVGVRRSTLPAAALGAHASGWAEMPST
jgi:hypothetical protein